MEIEEAIIEIKDASDSEVRYGDTKHHHEEVIKRVEAFDMAIKALKQQPTRPTGKWIDIGDEGLVFKCSLCGNKNTIESHFCPNCGARMEAEV